MEPINRSRRKAILMAMAIPALLLTPGFAQSREPDPITVDVSGVTDVPSLILAIRKAAGALLPASIRDKEFYAEIAKVFVRNARAASEYGFHIPQWVLDKLPSRRVALPLLVLGVAILMIGGVPFLTAVAIVISAVLASIVLMATAIGVALYEIAEYGKSI